MVNRELSENDLLLLKHDDEWALLRYVSKSLNFLLIFGGSPKVFAEEALETRWSMEQIEDYIKEHMLEDVRDRVSNIYKRENSKKIAYITVATDMRRKFFESYPGLLKRTKDNINFSKEHGYVRSVFGATRKLVEQLLRGEYDNRELSLMMRNLDNICANTDIQNLEASIIHPAMVDTAKTFRERGMGSRIFNMVHDSSDFFVPKEELEEAAKIIYERFERPLVEMKGIPLVIDFEVTDNNNGDYYKGGRDLQHYLTDYDTSNS